MTARKKRDSWYIRGSNGSVVITSKPKCVRLRVVTDSDIPWSGKPSKATFAWVDLTEDVVDAIVRRLVRTRGGKRAQRAARYADRYEAKK